MSTVIASLDKFAAKHATSVHITKSVVSRIVQLVFAILLIVPPLFSRDLNMLHSSMFLSLLLSYRWFVGGGKCGFLEIEYRLRGIPKQKAFIYQIIAPIVHMRYHSQHMIYKAVLLWLSMMSLVKIIMIKPDYNILSPYNFNPFKRIISNQGLSQQVIKK